MDIVFTKHAMDRIKERDILLIEIVDCLACSDRIVEDENLIVFMKKQETEEKLLVLICSMEEERCKIVTVFKTSKIKKFLYGRGDL